MTFNFESEVFQKLGKLLISENLYTQRTNNDARYDSFIAKYPPTSIESLTLDQYCLGKDSLPENFCWWLERGLEKVLGRYMPGTSRGHILYKAQNGEYYRNRALSDLTPEEALKYTTKIQSLIANANVDEDLLWIDDDEKIFARAGLKARVTIGDGRKLRILSAYHPDKVLVISSSEHLRHFLLELGHPVEEVPSKDRPIALMLLLKEYYEEAKRRFNADVTPYGFVKALYSDQLSIRPIKQTVPESETDLDVTEAIRKMPLNQILYGPPGTGKTYETISLAVKIAEPEMYQTILNENKDLPSEDLRRLFKERFDVLVADKRIAMTTFHQSFSYEDFIEGVRADTSQDEALKFKVEDGVFKQISEAASTKATSNISNPIHLKGRRIWKMSLGNTLENEDYIYQECLENDYILLGYGDNLDFSGCHTKEEVVKVYVDSNVTLTNTDYAVTSVFTFINSIKKNDLIIISDGNHKFRAIAEVVGDYEYLENADRNYFQQMRKVKWLQTYEPSKPKEQLFDKSLSQMTLYELGSKTINLDKLHALLEPHREDLPPEPYVLIIDEINRGNISRIFGELITLLEDSKRKGRTDALEVVLPYSKKPFSVPENLYVIGTMNTADKSLAQLDLALRRRFDFIEMNPQPDLLKGIKVHGVDIGQLLEIINERIEVLLDPEHQIGHSYFMGLREKLADNEREDQLAEIFKNKILPLLKEYFFDDWEKISLVLNDHSKQKDHRFLSVGGKRSVSELFGNSQFDMIQDRRSYVNISAFSCPEAYQGIIKV
ncbi:AAA family ATPase [Methylophilus medardicus]|uniref:ATPase n=1 Tax=Methylophilus medardicus TaxID=2588534 RepID=A0A5B8CTZ1_9PROT|nr:AAA family ATPase [Methylophilus medardicus]QDC44580.1 ATPase [Methylophilus medardicus]QDC49587.1 ATPase [Methylophilus medardicus]QDC53292.1 ATPase [Methylophilus medardicus]